MEPIRAELSQYPWDADEPLILLSREHVGSILARYLASELTEADLQQWAESLEMRDDVGFENADSRLLGNIVFVLANPEVNGALTPSVARQLIGEIATRSA